jgi:hypothetical protein
MSECRNCGSTALQDIGFVGEVAPFFLIRVLHLQGGFSVGTHPLLRFIRRRTKFLKRLFTKLYRPSVLVELQICRACAFLQTKFAFSESAIKNLYEDYRSDSYNKERIKYEPSYADVAKEVGINEKEVHNRVASLTAWLGSKVESHRQLSMLDFGGADGRFLPRLPGAKYVFEVSNIASAPGVVRIDSETALTNYSYVQVAHVLEHVPHPLALVKHICAFLDTGGYLYVEVPQEIDEETLAHLRGPENSISIGIHEHINRYTPQGIVALLKAAGLATIAVEAEVADHGWTKAQIIRGLARKIEVA